MNKTISLALSILSLVVLQACGGGGGGDGSADPSGGTGSDGTAAPAPSTSTDTGSVSAPFNRSDSARYQVINANSQVSGKLTTSVQETDGAMTTLQTNVLSGSKVVKDISGDATYAMGRWAGGTVTTSSGVATLTETSGSAYHYIAFNALDAIPTSGTTKCDAGTFTAPTYVSGNMADTTGSATGTASLNFGVSGAAVGGTINVSASGSSGSVAFSGTISTPTTMTINGAYLSNGAGTATQIGDGGSAAYLVVSNYAATLANGSRYMGIAKFRCS